MMSRRLGLLLSLLVLVLLVGCAQAFDASGTVDNDPTMPALTTDTGWWVDTTGTVSAERLAEWEAVSREIEKAGFQVGGAVFKNCANDPLAVATEFGNMNGIGSREKDNGIAVVVFTEKAGGDGNAPAISVAIGSGLEGVLNDAKVGRFLDQTYVPKRADGLWEEGLTEFLSLVRDYLVDPSSVAEEVATETAPWEWWMILLLVIAILVVAMVLSAAGGGSYSSSSGSGSNGGFSSGGGGSFGGGGASR